MSWNPPPLSYVYGPYFKPDVAEELQRVQMIQLALGGGPNAKEPIITRELAVTAIKNIFGIENVQAVIDAIADDEQTRQDTTVDNAVDMANSMPSPKVVPGAKPGAAPPKAKPSKKAPK